MVSQTAIPGVAEQTEWRKSTFLDLYYQYGPALARLASAYVTVAEDREDLVQEIAGAVWKTLPGYRGEASGRTWLYRIAHNVAITASVKVRARGQREAAQEQVFEIPAQGQTPEQHLLADEKRRAMLEGIRTLPTTDRQIVMLHLEGLSYAEIQEITGLSEGVVAARLTRIREKLRKAVRATEVGDGRQRRD